MKIRLLITFIFCFFSLTCTNRNKISDRDLQDRFDSIILKPEYYGVTNIDYRENEKLGVFFTKHSDWYLKNKGSIEKTLNHNYPNKCMGKMIYYVPDSMMLGKNYRVVVKITNNDYFIYIITYQKSNTYTIKNNIKDIKVGSKMIINLSDGGTNSFDITPIGNEMQSVDSLKEYSQWMWNINPKKVGNSQIIIIVSIINDGDAPDQIVNVTNVFVKENLFYRIQFLLITYWKEILGSLTSAAVSIFLFYRNRNNKISKKRNAIHK